MNTSPPVLLWHPYPPVFGIALCCFPPPSGCDEAGVASPQAGGALGSCPGST